jgi:(p)ppGpp synthase/HD superfamily hydrolase
MHIVEIKKAAREFATKAHEGQVRKYSGVPYITHPEAVAQMVEKLGLSDFAVAASYLHDTVEDTSVVLDDIYEVFGPEVAEMVSFLTAIKMASMSREDRKRVYREKMAHAPYEVQTIKVADILHNAPTIYASGSPEFVRLWLGEAKQMLSVLTKAHPRLLASAVSFIDGMIVGQVM